MSGPLVSASAAFVAKNSRKPPYAIEQSLRFNDDDSAYLQISSPTTATNGKIFTHSVWVKRSEISDNDNNIFGCSPATTLINDIKFDSNDRLYYRQVHSSGGAAQWSLVTAAQYRDPSAWLHIVVAVDTTQATSSDRVKMYVNGAQITEWNSESYPGQNQVPMGQQTYAIGIGRLTTFYTHYFDGYMAEYHYVDGTAHDPTDFGEYDANGVWRPIEVTGITYGNRGWYLTFDPSATNGIGHDHSGNANNFTANNFTTSGTGTDVMDDTPTTNWCTLNPLDNGTGNAPTNGNLAFNTTAAAIGTLTATTAVSSGKWYWEVDISFGSNNSAIGVRSIDELVNSATLGSKSNDYAYRGNGQKFNNNTKSSYGASHTTNDVIGIALDLDDGDIEFFKNNTSQGTAFTGLSGTFVPAISDDNTSSSFRGDINFGQRDFAYTPPTNFLPLNTANLPAPDIADGSKYFDTLLYTADNSSGKTVTGLNFGAAPDFVWIKNRDNVESHHLMDIVRGNDAFLFSNNTNQEQDKPLNDTNDTTDFDFVTDGFSFVSTNYNQGELYFNNRTYVAWNWLAGGSVSADNNTDGSITSTVSANPSAGFSIISYSGNSTNGATIGHGLGVAPAMFIVKAITNNVSSVKDWAVFHHKMTSTPQNTKMLLNTTDAESSVSTYWNNTAPTSTVITLGTNGRVNVTNEDYICYAFAEVEGYSKFGSYTGNSNANNAFVYTGFKPAFLLIKSSSLSVGWVIYDTARNTYNVTNRYLYPNTTGAEGTNNLDIDILSNGFKIRSTESVIGWAGNTYIFAAFAENPMGGSGVSPATAR